MRGKRLDNRLRSPLTRNVRVKRPHSDLSPTGRGEEVLAPALNALEWLPLRSIRTDLLASGGTVGGAGRFAIFRIPQASPYFNDRLVSGIVTL